MNCFCPNCLISKALPCLWERAAHLEAMSNELKRRCRTIDGYYFHLPGYRFGSRLFRPEEFGYHQMEMLYGPQAVTA